MKYEISQGSFPTVSFTLEEGERIQSQSGAMCWMDEDVLMETNMKGGLLQGIGRLVSQESMFVNTFSAKKDDAQITLTNSRMGSVFELNISQDQQILAQKSAFLCSEDTVATKIEFTKKLSAGLFGGEGFVLQKFTGEGLLFLETSGTVVKKELANGEILLVDAGHMVAFQSSVEYTVTLSKGMKNLLFGGDALLAKFKGPGTVWLQTHTISNLAAAISPYISSK